MSKKILVVGAGAWGTAIANVLSKNNNKVYLWTRDKSLSIKINSNKINHKYYRNFKLFKFNKIAKYLFKTNFRKN